MITTKSLYKTVTTSDGHLDLLKNINFSVEVRQTLAIVGSSGAGKSTLLGLIAGLDSPSSGEIYLGSHCITAVSYTHLTLPTTSRV